VKPKVVFQEQVVFQGNSAYRDVTCCEYNRRTLHSLEQIDINMRAIADQVRPSYPGNVMFINPPLSKIEMNFCPTCGTEFLK
jgi:hypothetical protein